MGGYAIDLLHRGEKNRVICLKGGNYVDFDIDEALSMTKELDPFQLSVSRIMAR